MIFIYFNKLTDTRDSRELKHTLTDCIIMTIFGILASHYVVENIVFLKINKNILRKN